MIFFSSNCVSDVYDVVQYRNTLLNEIRNGTFDFRRTADLYAWNELLEAVQLNV